MKRNNSVQRGQIRGYLFEIILIKILKENGFTPVKKIVPKRIKEVRKDFYEVKGRGTWHQIDCLCDYNTLIPFFYPIRMIGEAKFYSNPIDKSKIREFIGVVKDIQENYFVGENLKDSSARVSELGVFFSANEFNEEAEKLAYAHNIKTISYKNNVIIEMIKEKIMEFESKYIDYNLCFSSEKTNKFLTLFNSILNGDIDISKEMTNYVLDPLFQTELVELRNDINNIKSNFIGTTSSGVFLHFLGNNEFPDELFKSIDEIECKVHYTDQKFHLIFNGDTKNRKYYFTPPKSLNEIVFKGDELILSEKERIFGQIQIFRKINGIKRILTIKIDKKWLKKLKKEKNVK